MDIIAAARELGRAIQNDERYIAFNAARAANDADESLQAQIGEFNLTRMQIDDEMSRDERDDEKIKELNEKLRKVYSDIMMTENMQAYNNAKSALDEVITRMNSVIDQCLAGEDPDSVSPASGCTGSCASCSGCH